MSKTKRKTSKNEAGDVVIRLSDLGIVQKTPEQADLQIQIERVMHIMDGSIEKLKVAACLPAFLKDDACWLRMHCGANDVEYIKNACLKYTLPDYFPGTRRPKAVEKTSVIIDKISRNQHRKFVRTLDTMVDPHIAHVLELLWNNNALKEKSLQDYEKLTDDNAQTFITCVKNLRRIAEIKLPQTASEQRDREKYLRKTWKENQTMEEKIRGLQTDIDNQRNFFQSQIEEKQRLVFDAENKIEELMKNFNCHVKEKTYSSEEMMAQNALENNATLEILNNASRVITQQYEGLLSEHLKLEKKLRAKRYKTETQLISWLNKFDDDMNERQGQYDEIKEAYEIDKVEMEKLQIRYDIQEKDYLIVMAEKLHEERQQLEIMVQNMARNHAARVIQRHWRLYCIAKSERSKSKKGKGKRK